MAIKSKVFFYLLQYKIKEMKTELMQKLLLWFVFLFYFNILILWNKIMQLKYIYKLNLLKNKTKKLKVYLKRCVLLCNWSDQKFAFNSQWTEISQLTFHFDIWTDNFWEIWEDPCVGWEAYIKPRERMNS